MKLISYILVLLVIFGLMYGIGLYVDSSKPATLTHEAVDPDILLSNSKQYFQEHAHARGLAHLQKAIEAIKEIEQEIDPESREKVDAAVEELEEIHAEMSAHEFNVEDLNRACVKALDALTYAELKVSEHFIESNELDKAKMALKYGMLHVKNALLFSEGTKKEYEISLYAEMDSLIENENLSNQEIILRLEDLITDLDNHGL